MPRHPRLFIQGACYHVYSRVARGEFVFDDSLEADKFVEAVRRVRDSGCRPIRTSLDRGGATDPQTPNIDRPLGCTGNCRSEIKHEVSTPN